MYIIEFFGRIFLSALFLIEGIRKLFYQEETIIYMEDHGVPGILFIPSVILEILFPLLIIVGYKTKLAALVMTLFTFAVAIIFHADFHEDMQLVFFLKDLAIAGGFITIFFYGANKISLDNYFKSKQ